MDFSERVKHVMRELQLNQVGLADKVGLSRSVISEFASGAREPSKEFIFALTKLNVSIDWFVTGVGDMFLSNSSEIQNEQVKNEKKTSLNAAEELSEISMRITNIAEKLNQPILVPTRLQPLVEIATRLDDARLNQVIGSASILYDQQKGELTDSQNAHLSAG